MDNNKGNIGFECGELSYEIVRQIKETEEEFAYAMISPFCERIVEKKLNKKELERILRKGMQQESILDKIRAEIIQSIQNGTIKIESGTEMLFRIIDLYKAESEGKNEK